MLSCPISFLVVFAQSKASMAVDEWRLWEMFLVAYKVGDPVSLLMALVSMLPVLIAVGMAASFLTVPRRSVLAFMIGLLINEVLNSILKKHLNEPRPPRPYHNPMLKEGLGNPSSHAQFCAFLACWYAARLPSKDSLVPCNFRRILMVSLLAAAICYSRVYNQHHTVGQVGLGIIVGMIVALGLRTSMVLDRLADLLYPLAALVRRVFFPPSPVAVKA
jgi:membrane-associated phospholipid phosphatase